MTDTEIAIKTYPEFESGTETETVRETEIVTERLTDTQVYDRNRNRHRQRKRQRQRHV